MTTVAVTVEYSRGQIDLALPMAVPCHMLAGAIARQLKLEGADHKAYVFGFKNKQGTRRIPSNNTLAGSAIFHGSILVLLEEDLRARPAAPSLSAALHLQGANVTLPLLGGANMIGRNDPKRGIQVDIDLSLYDSARILSRRHAEIHYKAGYFLEDAGSVNGTWHNGTRLAAHQAQRLSDGDEIVLGRNGIKLIFHCDGG